jgi:hypothetical protein
MGWEMSPFFFIGGTGVGTQGHTLARQSLLAQKPLLQPFFVMGFEIRSHELFAWAGFELGSS